MIDSVFLQFYLSILLLVLGIFRLGYDSGFEVGFLIPHPICLS